MKVLFDTSVLVAALVRSHPHHPQAWPWLDRAHRGELEMLVASHTLAELYATLTTLPVRPRISPDTALHLMVESVTAHAAVVALGGSDYTAVLEGLKARGITGGATYDALLARAAQKAEANLLLTLNGRDFHRIWPEGADRIRRP